MAVKNPKRLVIDASIARASGGEDAIHPTSINCRNFLKEILKLCHSIIMTHDLQEEWINNWSRYASLWLTQMESKRKRKLLSDVVDYNLRQKIITNASDDGSRKAMIKDIILIEAAIYADNTIASLDETV